MKVFRMQVKSGFIGQSTVLWLNRNQECATYSESCTVATKNRFLSLCMRVSLDITCKTVVLPKSRVSLVWPNLCECWRVTLTGLWTIVMQTTLTFDRYKEKECGSWSKLSVFWQNRVNDAPMSNAQVETALGVQRSVVQTIWKNRPMTRYRF